MALSTPELIKKVLNQRVRETLVDETLMPAAVMVLLYPKNGEYCILLNKRSELVEHHKGEISFPGGARDPQDRDFLDTALRETEEEMGIQRGDITVLGQLDDIVTRSRFGVRVYCGTIPYPYPFVPSAIEIAEVLEVPLPSLYDPANIRVETRWNDGEFSTVYSYTHEKHVVFGATAKILQQFLEVLQDEWQKGGITT
ncbi:MAG: NUDIX hydrolase [Dehalococcoidia bacterium]